MSDARDSMLGKVERAMHQPDGSMPVGHCYLYKCTSAYRIKGWK